MKSGNTGPINIHALVEKYKKAKGDRPRLVGLEGTARSRAQAERTQWDSGLFALSPLIRTSCANDVCEISEEGQVVPKRRRS